MEYIIQNLDLITPASQKLLFEKEVVKKAKQIEKLLEHYPKNPTIEIYIKKEGSTNYKVTITLNLKEKTLTVEEKGTQPVNLVNNAMDKLRTQVSNQLHLERKEYLYKRKQRLVSKVEDSKSLLKEQARNQNQNAFARTVMEIFPEIQKYIRREITRKPVLARMVNKRLLGIEDIMDEVYLDLYNELQKKPDIPEKLVLWAYSDADKKLKKLNEKYSTELKETVSTERLNIKEMREMEEQMSSNADYMPVLTEELEEPDEQFFTPEDYDVQEILLDAGAEQEIINKAEMDDTKNKVTALLQELPEEHQSVFELSYLHRFSPAEIARIKDMKEIQVEQILKENRQHILNRMKG